MLINAINVGILTFMSRKHFMFSCVEHEKSFITSGPEDNFSLMRLIDHNVDISV